MKLVFNIYMKILMNAWSLQPKALLKCFLPSDVLLVISFSHFQLLLVCGSYSVLSFLTKNHALLVRNVIAFGSYSICTVTKCHPISFAVFVWNLARNTNYPVPLAAIDAHYITLLPPCLTDDVMLYLSLLFLSVFCIYIDDGASWQ